MIKKSLYNRQGQGGGARSRVDQAIWPKFKVYLSGLGQKHFTSKELRDLFGEFSGGCRYEPGYFSHLLRTRLQMYYYKPSPRDYRRPVEAERQLQDRLEACLDALGVMGKDPTKMAIGFSDEAVVQMQSNNARLWSLEAHSPRLVNTDRKKQAFFGFYALQGQSVLLKMSGSKAEDFKALLLELKAANPEAKGLILVWDNAPAHKKVEQWAWQQDIYIVPLPPYSPDLNPIERLWKSCKRWVNEQGFCKKLEDLVSRFQQSYDHYKVQRSFASGWCEKMSSIFSWNSAESAEVSGELCSP